MLHPHPRFIRRAMGAITSLAASPFLAAEPLPETKPTRPAETVLTAVTVVGSKNEGYAPAQAEVGIYRGLDMLDIPATVNVVSRQAMDDQGATGLYDALRNVAGVVRQQQSGIAYDQLSVRGINLDNRSSYLINGVLPFDNNLPIPMENKERVEVLKGAAALHYGFLDPGGVVNLVTKRATATPVSAFALSTDNNGSALAHVDLGRRLGERQQFGVRVNALGNSVHTPIAGDNGYRHLFSAALDWKASNRLSLKYDFEYIRARITEQAGIVPPPATQGTIRLPAIPDPTRLLSMKGKDTESDAVTHLLGADYAFNEHWTARLTLGQSITRRDRWLWVFDTYNVDTGAGSVYGADQQGQTYRNRNVRAEINGIFKTGPIGHDVLVGASQNWLYQPSFDTYMYRAAQNLYDPVAITSLIRAPRGPKRTLRDRAFYEQTVRNGGVFALDRITVGERWQVVGALRYSRYSSDQLNSPSYDASATSPALSVLYKATPRLSVYGSYIEGLESAGTAPVTADNAGQSLPAAVSRQKEIGVRSRIQGDLLVSAAVFELGRPSASTGRDNVYALNGKERYRGLELSLQGSLTRNLSILASGTLLDARVLASANANLVGKRPENVPKRTASVFLNYRVPQLPGLSVSAGAYAIGARPVNNLNQASISGYTTFTAGIGYSARIHGTRATFRAHIDNLTNKRYWSAAGSGQLAVGLPRTATLTATFEL